MDPLKASSDKDFKMKNYENRKIFFDVYVQCRVGRFLWLLSQRGWVTLIWICLFCNYKGLNLWQHVKIVRIEGKMWNMKEKNKMWKCPVYKMKCSSEWVGWWPSLLPSHQESHNRALYLQNQFHHHLCQVFKVVESPGKIFPSIKSIYRILKNVESNSETLSNWHFLKK